MTWIKKAASTDHSWTSGKASFACGVHVCPFRDEDLCVQWKLEWLKAYNETYEAILEADDLSACAILHRFKERMFEAARRNGQW